LIRTNKPKDRAKREQIRGEIAYKFIFNTG